MISRRKAVEVALFMCFQLSPLMQRLRDAGFKRGLRVSTERLAAEERRMQLTLVQGKSRKALTLLQLREYLCRRRQAGIVDLGLLRLQRLQVRLAAVALVEQFGQRTDLLQQLTGPGAMARVGPDAASAGPGGGLL